MTTQDKVSRRSRRVATVPRNPHAMIEGMAAPKGRPQRARNGERALYAEVAPDIIERLEAGAVALNLSRAAYIERLVREMPVDERGLPPWLAELADAEQLPLMQQEEPKRAA